MQREVEEEETAGKRSWVPSRGILVEGGGTALQIPAQVGHISTIVEPHSEVNVGACVHTSLGELLVQRRKELHLEAKTQAVAATALRS